MAISGVHYRLLKEHANLLKRGGSLLEIGEANWYGDVEPVECILHDNQLENDPFYFRYNTFKKTIESGNLFAIARIAYEVLWSPKVVHSVDINGTKDAFRQDLNGPLKLPRKYDTIINHGTAEHVFNIAHVFKSMHDACVTGGYMIHESPFTGWVDHGFYTLQPTLFYDVAHANEYEVISLSICEIKSGTIIRVESREHLHALTELPNNALLFVVMRKTVDKPFRIPMQGVYDLRLSEEGIKAWQEKR